VALTAGRYVQRRCQTGKHIFRHDTGHFSYALVRSASWFGRRKLFADRFFHELQGLYNP
jgi:hypothetical protein